MRILVCGGRDFANPVPYDHSPENKKAMDEYIFVQRELDKISIEFSKEYKPDDNWLPSDIEIISGMAEGVDSAAIDWAVCSWCKTHEYPADWEKHGKRAGPIRNEQMVREGRPDLVVAFPGGTGTADMVKRAKKAGLDVREITYVNEGDV